MIKRVLTKKKLAYTAYGVTMIAVFLYLSFPSEKIKHYIESAFTKNNQEFTLSIGSIKPVFPPAMELENFILQSRKRPDIVVEADSIAVRPNFGSLLNGRLVLDVNANSNNGCMQARICFINRFSAHYPVSIDAELENVSFDEYISKDTIAFLNNPTFTFEDIRTTLILNKRTIKVNDLEVNGKEVSGSFSGKISLDGAIDKSNVGLKGTIEVYALNKGFPMIINGTLRNPILRLE